MQLRYRDVPRRRLMPRVHQSDTVFRHMSHPDVGEVEMATSSGMSAVSGTLDIRASTLGSERETMDATSLPLSVSSDTAFTSFYGSQANLKVASRSMPRVSSNSYLDANAGAIGSTWQLSRTNLMGLHTPVSVPDRRSPHD